MNKCYLAFPGLGKTTVCKKRSNSIDLDFGFYRSSNSVSKNDESRLLPSFSKLLYKYYIAGYDVFTNEPAIMPFLKQNKVEVEVLLPADPTSIPKRIYKRNEPGDALFANLLTKNVEDWVEGWKQAAYKYGFRVNYVNYLSDFPALR